MSDAAGWRELHRRSAAALRERLERTFAALERELDAPEEVLARRPGPGSWSPSEVLEHVALTSHYLLLLAEKIGAKSRARLARGEPWPTAPPRHEHVAAVATDRRAWAHPEHMTPTGDVSAARLDAELRERRARALALLDEMPAGEGTLHGIRVSVLGDERQDLYQLLDFVGRHAERHLAQIARARQERGV